VRRVGKDAYRAGRDTDRDTVVREDRLLEAYFLGYFSFLQMQEEPRQRLEQAHLRGERERSIKGHFGFDPSRLKKSVHLLHTCEIEK